MPYTVIRNDITKMNVDAIVNAANNHLKMGGGVCGAIFQAAGASELQQECNTIGYCKTGDAVITPGYNLPAKHIVHTVSPIWHGGKSGEPDALSNCYKNSLYLALKANCESIAFPLISSGIFGYPKDQALHIATTIISEFLLEHEMDVYLVVYDRKAFDISEKRFKAVEKYIDDHYVDDHVLERKDRYSELYSLETNDLAYSSFGEAKEGLEDVLDKLEESFSERLIRLIDQKKRTDIEIYKKANIDRKLFSKIRNNKDYKPSKPTAVAFAVALELNLDETLDLLKSAGLSLSHSYKFDLVVEYFIQKKNYNIFELNETLFKFDQPLLGA